VAETVEVEAGMTVVATEARGVNDVTSMTTVVDHAQIALTAQTAQTDQAGMTKAAEIVAQGVLPVATMEVVDDLVRHVADRLPGEVKKETQ
jgi:glutamine synthetase type III